VSNCPYCQFPEAYDSGFQVECPNPDCRYFSLTQCKEFVTNEVRRRCVRAISGEPGMPAFPKPFTAGHPEPMLLAISWPQPTVVEELRITWHFQF